MRHRDPSVSALLLAGLLAMCVASMCPAQDSLKLEDGRFLQGEILGKKNGKIRFVTKAARLMEVDPTDVVKERRGRKIHPKIRAMLAKVDAEDPVALFEIVQRIEGKKAWARDAVRLARRAVAFDPEFEEARKFLGHVKYGDVWYSSKEEAHEALTEKMTAAGYVFESGGWVKAEKAGRLKSQPDAFILVDDLIWRPLEEVMRERGYELWDGQWYPPEEKAIIIYLKRFQKRIGVKAHGAMKGAVRVIHVQGRESAQETAQELDQARNWFCDTFQVGPKSRPDIRRLREEPFSFHYVLSDEAELARFAEAYKDKFKFQDLALTLPRKHALWPDMGHAIHLGESLWRNYLVAQLGGTLMQWYWHRGFPLPAWIWVASAHHAEIAVFGQARTQYVTRAKYDRTTNPPGLDRRNLSAAKEDLRDLYEAKEVKSIRELFAKSFNELDSSDDLFGVVLFDWFVKERSKAWFGFLSGPKSGALQKRFEKYFGGKFEKVERDFKAWVMAD
ncbi:MAG TPA: hypothetical protein ENK43_09370 [Planctomycetes bacterium]|nr:hypothetical protein [Planctomycetota bacterium]